VQASRFDFYFSHRVWFFFKSVLFNRIADRDKEEQQRIATDKFIRALWNMVKEHCDDDEETKNQIDPDRATYVFGSPSSDRPELLYLANSFDLIDLLIKFNLAQYYPQLQASKYVEEMQSKQKLLHEETINSWQGQRMIRVNKIVSEYKEKGWFMHDSLDALKQPFDLAYELPNYQAEYLEAKITARDIILLPFQLEPEDSAGRFTMIRETELKPS
jgi:hypothetical protein